MEHHIFFGPINENTFCFSLPSSRTRVAVKPSLLSLAISVLSLKRERGVKCNFIINHLSPMMGMKRGMFTISSLSNVASSSFSSNSSGFSFVFLRLRALIFDYVATVTGPIFFGICPELFF